MAPFHTTRRVEFHDTDMAGIIHFSNYYLYMEQAEHELFRSLGLKIHGQFPDGTTYGWPPVATSASFHAPARYEDLLDVRLSILRRGQITDHRLRILARRPQTGDGGNEDSVVPSHRRRADRGHEPAAGDRRTAG
ncbi:MAG: hotdog domain-containing protein [Polyangiaceae bacterium]